MDERTGRKARPAQPRGAGGRFAATKGAQRVFVRDNVPVGEGKAVRVAGRTPPSRKEYERLSAELDESQRRVRELEEGNASLRAAAYSPVGVSYKFLFEASVQRERYIKARCVRASAETDGLVKALRGRIEELATEAARCRRNYYDARTLCADWKDRAERWRSRFRFARLAAFAASAVAIAAAAALLARGFGG